jgi:tetratricopeptide (TPR) repeat protein
MEPPDIYEALKLADERDQIGYARYLGELYLKDHPGHGPTLIRYACNLISLAQYSKAEEALDCAQKVVPKEWLHLALAQRGHLLEAKGHYASAEALFMEAHDLDPDDATYLIYASSVASKKGDLERAIRLARKATECPEGRVDEAYFNLGGCFLSTQQYREAAGCYRKALEIDPDYDIAKERLADVTLILESQASPQ